jgi:hypothetical protein
MTPISIVTVTHTLIKSIFFNFDDEVNKNKIIEEPSYESSQPGNASIAV